MEEEAFLVASKNWRPCAIVHLAPATGRSCTERGAVLADFNVASLYILPTSGATTRFLGLPLPPFLKIDILPEALGGTVDRATGQVTVCT
jgi:hypothetical protein